VLHERPGKTDPVQNPARYKLFSDDAIYLPAAKNQMEVTLRRAEANLKNWIVQIEDTGHCATGGRPRQSGEERDPRRDRRRRQQPRLLAGVAASASPAL